MQSVSTLGAWKILRLQAAAQTPCAVWFVSESIVNSRQLCTSSGGTDRDVPKSQQINALQPHIPVWCMLPKVSQNNAVVRSSKFLTGAYSHSQLPPEQYPEVAIVGRSNVGKSSLVNYILGSRSLAKVSKQPGKTRSINHYLINRSWCLVDCPGYGYAVVSKDTRADWNAFTQQYFTSRSNLTDVLLLIDASLPPKDMDLAGVSWLTKRTLPVTLVFTKIDKSKPRLPAPADNILAFRAALEEDGGPLAIPPHFATSSTAQKGKEALLLYLAQRRAQHAQQAEQALAVAAAAAAGPAGQPSTTVG